MEKTLYKRTKRGIAKPMRKAEGLDFVRKVSRYYEDCMPFSLDGLDRACHVSQDRQVPVEYRLASSSNFLDLLIPSSANSFSNSSKLGFSIRVVFHIVQQWVQEWVQALYQTCPRRAIGLWTPRRMSPSLRIEFGSTAVSTLLITVRTPPSQGVVCSWIAKEH